MQFKSPGLPAVLLCAALGAVAGCKQDSSQTESGSYTSPVPGSVSDNGETGGGNGQTPSDPNQSGAPFVTAGKDQAADPNVMLMLEGSVTTASGGAPASVYWTQIEGPTVQLLTPNQVSTALLAPDVQVPTLLRFRFSAQDTQGKTNSDTAVITVSPLDSFLRVVGGTVAETAEIASFTILLNEPSNLSVTVTYTTQDVTAAAGEDYVQTNGSIEIQPGATSASIPVTLLPDTAHEIHEHFLLKIVGVVNGQTAASSGVVVIQDDDPPGSSTVTVTAQGLVDGYSEQKRAANVLGVPYGYSSFRHRDLIVALNGEHATVDSATGSYQFATPVAVDSTYSASLVQQPGNLQCAIANASGTVPATSFALDIQCQPVTEHLDTPVQIATGQAYSCVLDTKGVTCWGDNSSGQTQVPDLEHPITIDAGDTHACAIDNTAAGHRAVCWGFGDDDSSADPATVPATILNPSQITAGNDHTCVLDGSEVKCWGFNGSGQSTVPALVNPVAVDAGRSQTCAIDSSGVKCWGNGYESGGQYENAIPALENPQVISVGGGHACAVDLTSSGNRAVLCWGENFSGQTDVPTLPALTNPIAVSAGENHTCAIDQVGSGTSVVCWGAGDDSEVTTPPTLESPQAIAAGGTQFNVGFRSHSCAIDANGLQCWGDNEFGQSTTSFLLNPQSIVAGYNHVCARSDNGVSCWGYGGDGQTTVPPLTGPTILAADAYHNCALDGTEIKCWGWDGETGRVDAAPGTSLPNVSALALGEGISCALFNPGSAADVACWGFGSEGEDISSEVLINPSHIAAGEAHTCASDDTGLVCVGNDFTGQTTDRPAVQNVRSLVAGDNHSCVLDDSGVQCWGDGYGQYGSYSVPTSLQNPRSIYAGGDLSCAIDDNGAQCWGGLSSSGIVEELMASLIDPKSLAMGGIRTCGLDDEAIKCVLRPEL